MAPDYEKPSSLNLLPIELGRYRGFAKLNRQQRNLKDGECKHKMNGPIPHQVQLLPNSVKLQS